MINRQIILVIIAMFIYCNNCYALKEKTHYAINENIATNITIDKFKLSEYVTNSLGYFSGVDLQVAGIDGEGNPKSYSIAEWLAYGGEQEDRPGIWYDYLWPFKQTRSLNHFHNPLYDANDWDQAGLNDMGKSGQSSILWAQNDNQDPSGNMGGRSSVQHCNPRHGKVYIAGDISPHGHGYGQPGESVQG